MLVVCWLVTTLWFRTFSGLLARWGSLNICNLRMYGVPPVLCVESQMPRVVEGMGSGKIKVCENQNICGVSVCPLYAPCGGREGELVEIK